MVVHSGCESSIATVRIPVALSTVIAALHRSDTQQQASRRYGRATQCRFDFAFGEDHCSLSHETNATELILGCVLTSLSVRDGSSNITIESLLEVLCTFFEYEAVHSWCNDLLTSLSEYQLRTAPFSASHRKLWDDLQKAQSCISADGRYLTSRGAQYFLLKNKINICHHSRVYLVASIFRDDKSKQNFPSRL